MAAIIKSVPPVDEPSLKISEYPIPAFIPQVLQLINGFRDTAATDKVHSQLEKNILPLFSLNTRRMLFLMNEM